MKILNILAVLLAMSACPQMVHAQSTFETYGVENWDKLVPERRVDFQTYRSSILVDLTLTPEEKTAKVNAKFEAIRWEVTQIRTDLYANFSRTVGVGNSATKGNSGGKPKKAKRKCESAGLPNMYTTPAWARGAYKSGKDHADARIFESGSRATDIIDDNGTKICAVALKQSGKGRKVSYSRATFRIRQAEISRLVNAEVLTIMDLVSKSPV